MNPPLRSRADRDALREAALDGTIDIIATDHAPHSAAEKSKGLSQSAMGITGLECAFATLYTGLVRTVLDWAQGAPLVDVLSRADLAAGDLVRWCKQVIDVLDQLREAAPDPATRKRANEAIALVRRGIVAQEIA